MEKNPPVIKKINDLLSTVDKESQRYKVLETALAFKTNWIELGKKLHEVYKSEKFREWGYKTFEKYCFQEIGIRKKTAEKLTMSYFYLQNHEPKILENANKKSIPELNTINVLAQAKTDGNISEDNYEELKQAAFEDGCNDRTLKKRYKDFIEETNPAQDEYTPEDEDTLSHKDISSLIQSFEQIDRKTEEMQGIPVEIKTDIRKILVKLKTLID